MSDRNLAVDLERASKGLVEATQNMAGPSIRKAVEDMTTAVANILPRFAELAFDRPVPGPTPPDPPSECAPEGPEEEPDPPMGSSKVYLSARVESDIHSIACSMSEISNLMRKDKEDRTRGSIPRT